MKTRMLVVVIGIGTALLGCATKDIPEGPPQHVRLADAAPGWNGALTVNADQIFDN